MAKNAFVDPDCCISCGLCVSICPGAFKFNDSGKSECYNQNGATEAEKQSAIDGCPVQAISWSS